MSVTYKIACKIHKKCITLGNDTAAGFILGYNSKEPIAELNARIGKFIFEHCDDGDLLLLDEHTISEVGFKDTRE